jgi:uncharacterized Tic20 family protein
MGIYIAKDGQQLGPYEVSGLVDAFSAGAIALTDLAWSEGEAEWAVLSEFASKKGIVLAPLSAPSGPPPIVATPLPKVPPPPPSVLGGLSSATGSYAVSQDSKNSALIIWIGSLFFGFIPGLIFYLTKKDDAYIQDQSKEALNWSITTVIGYIAGFILTFILIGIIVFVVLGICHLVFCIMGAVAASNGKAFRVPFAIRLIK